jgi:hypothetical protein
MATETNERKMWPWIVERGEVLEEGQTSHA